MRCFTREGVREAIRRELGVPALLIEQPGAAVVVYEVDPVLPVFLSNSDWRRFESAHVPAGIQLRPESVTAILAEREHLRQQLTERITTAESETLKEEIARWRQLCLLLILFLLVIVVRLIAGANP